MERACARRRPIPPRPAVGHARCAPGAGGPFKAGAAERAPAPPAAPPRREVCARRPAALCALLGVGLAAEGGRARTGRRGRRAAPPPGSPGAASQRARRKEALRAGPGHAACSPAAAPCPSARARRAATPGRCPLGSRARSPLLPALPGSPRPRARPAGSLRKRPGLRFAANARVRAAGRPPGTMRPCGRRRYRAHSGDLTVPRGELGARRQRLPGACSLGDPGKRASARASVCPASDGPGRGGGHTCLATSWVRRAVTVDARALGDQAVR